MYNEFIESVLISLVIATTLGVAAGAFLGYVLRELENKYEEESDNE
jgi:phosphate/sulfate permease